jgi:hypothetical protein
VVAVKDLVEAGVTVTDRRTDQRMDPGETVLVGAEAAQVEAVPVVAAHSVPTAHFLTSTV